MSPEPVIKQLDAVKDSQPGFRPAVFHDELSFGFQAVGKTFRHGIVPAIAFTAHTADYAVLFQDFPVVFRAILRNLDPNGPVHHHADGGAQPPFSALRNLQGFFAIDPLDPFMVVRPSVTSEQRNQPPGSPPLPLARFFPQDLTQRTVILFFRRIRGCIFGLSFQDTFVPFSVRQTGVTTFQKEPVCNFRRINVDCFEKTLY